ncbi:MAG: N-acetylglucosamine-6-phosphate deacetylase [Bacilli bacterium]|nr:N-acetylglucosamine-6-phosphate deacetylase [Bacilli bacterium]
METILGFKNTFILTEEGIIKTNIIIKDGIINYIGNKVIDGLITLPDDQILVPGFIDEHMHGINGYDVMDGSVETLRKIAEEVAKEGVTSFLATTSTASIQKTINTLHAVKAFKEIDNSCYAEIIGAHLEGPFLSKTYQGAQLGEYIINPSISLMKEFIIESGNNVKLVTLAPEEENGLDLIKYLKEHNIIASVGHSNATFNIIEQSIKQGLTTVTHTYNAQKPIHHREVGVVGAAMLFDELYTELICDGIHVSNPAVKLLCKNKPLNKIVLITDSLPEKGLKDGVYLDNDQEIYVKNNELRLKDGTLAGSSLTMNQAIKNIINFTGVSLTNAINFATSNPAKNLNIFDKVGSIKVGKLANFAVIDKELNVYQTIRCGNIIYKKGTN